VDSIGLRAQAAGSGARLVEVAAKGRGQERAEDNVGTAEEASAYPSGRERMQNHLPESGERQPQEEDKLEGIIEREPVDDANEALDNTSMRLACAMAPAAERTYVKNAKTTQYYGIH
jgi:hypothetical protein